MLATMKEWWGDEYSKYVWDNHLRDNRFKLIKKYQVCQRYFIPKSFDERMITYFQMAVCLVAVCFVLVSYAVIFAMILKSRKTFKGNKQEPGRRQKIRAQNIKIVKAAAIISGITLLPWLPKLIFTVLFEAGLQSSMEKALGERGLFGLLDAIHFLFYVVPWIFPLINFFTHPVITKSFQNFKRR
jgi:hypothetical protein